MGRQQYGFYFFRSPGNPIYRACICHPVARMPDFPVCFPNREFFFKALHIDFQVFALANLRVNGKLFNQYLALQSTYHTFVLLKAK